MKTRLTMKQMKACIEVFDQTIGCLNCGEVWWEENLDLPFELIHRPGCPLRGNLVANYAAGRHQARSRRRPNHE